MATYKAFLFNMVTDNGSSIEMTGRHGRLDLTVIKENDIPSHIVFRSMDTLQNFISINTDKGLTNEQIVDKLATILYENEVTYYE